MFAARRLLAAPSLTRVITRQLHATPRRLATGPLWSFERTFGDPEMQEWIQQFSRHPRLIACVARLGDILKKHGVNVHRQPDKEDSMMLMEDPDFREVMQTLTEEMAKAGVPVKPELFFHIAGTMRKPKNEEEKKP